MTKKETFKRAVKEMSLIYGVNQELVVSKIRLRPYPEVRMMLALKLSWNNCFTHEDIARFLQKSRTSVTKAVANGIDLLSNNKLSVPRKHKEKLLSVLYKFKDK